MCACNCHAESPSLPSSPPMIREIRIRLSQISRCNNIPHPRGHARQERKEKVGCAEKRPDFVASTILSDQHPLKEGREGKNLPKRKKKRKEKEEEEDGKLISTEPIPSRPKSHLKFVYYTGGPRTTKERIDCEGPPLSLLALSISRTTFSFSWTEKERERERKREGGPSVPSQ